MTDSTQQVKGDDCLTPRQSTTIALDYPSIPVDGTPDSWLSNSLLVHMASNQEEGSVRSNDDTMSSLGDSSYDFVDDNSFATTDDEDSSRMADSVSVTGKSGSEGLGIHDLERTLSVENVPILSSNSSKRDSVDDFASSLVSREGEGAATYSSRSSQQEDADKQSSNKRENIKLEEIRNREGTYFLKSSPISKHRAVTIKLHLLEKELSIERPYRLFYAGDLAARERIVTKVGAALASTVKLEVSGPSRYNVIPMPSADDPTCWGEPVLLDSSGYEVVVYHCSDASIVSTNNGHDSIDLTMDDNTHIRSSRDSTGFLVTGKWELPDIAIFYLSDRDNISAKQTRRLARSFMARHKVPSIIITEKPYWERYSEAMTIDHLTPHICLQTENGTSSPRIIKRLPIDISIFSRLDALQLNQNLAYLNMASSSQRARGIEQPVQSTDRGSDGSRYHTLKSRYNSFVVSTARQYLGAAVPVLPYVLRFLAAAGLCLIVSFMVSQLFVSTPRSMNEPPSSHAASSSTRTAIPSSVATSTASLQGRSTATQHSTLPDLAKTYTPHSNTGDESHTDLTTLWLGSSATTINRSERFKAHVLGKTHIILRPPHWFTKLRKTPRLTFNVTQGGRVLKHEVSTLFDGVYALELPKDDAHGLVNISVWTDSKPKIHEKLKADFGNPWLHVAGWRRAASTLNNTFRQDLDVMQVSLSAAYVRSSTAFHALMQSMSAKADVLKNKTQGIGKESTDHMTKLVNFIPAFPSEIISSISQSFEERQIAAAKEVSLRTLYLRRSISTYVSEKARLGRKYLHATPTACRIQVRSTQKKALKLWWGVVGLPSKRPVSVRAEGKSRSCGGKRRKQPTGW